MQLWIRPVDLGSASRRGDPLVCLAVPLIVWLGPVGGGGSGSGWRLVAEGVVPQLQHARAQGHRSGSRGRRGVRVGPGGPARRCFGRSVAGAVALASAPAACSRLCAIAAHSTHAELAPKHPEGMWTGWSVDQVGEHGLDERVTAVDDVGLRCGQVCVGEERVVAPHGEQRTCPVGVTGASLTRRTTSRARIRSWVAAKAM
jgi:hypothetical protein